MSYNICVFQTVLYVINAMCYQRSTLIIFCYVLLFGYIQHCFSCIQLLSKFCIIQWKWSLSVMITMYPIKLEISCIFPIILWFGLEYGFVVFSSYFLTFQIRKDSWFLQRSFSKSHPSDARMLYYIFSLWKHYYTSWTRLEAELNKQFLGNALWYSIFMSQNKIWSVIL